MAKYKMYMFLTFRTLQLVQSLVETNKQLKSSTKLLPGDSQKFLGRNFKLFGHMTLGPYTVF